MNTMEKTIITEFKNRQQFFELQKINPGLIIVKLGADWCGPCKQIKDVVHGFFASSPDNVVCADINVDESFDFYSFLKARKIVNGIPALLCYQKGNLNFMPDLINTGADPVQLDTFLKKCGQLASQMN
jgi:thioredoxin-like negative regulator of GroEL